MSRGGIKTALFFSFWALVCLKSLRLTDLEEWFILMWFVKVVKSENSFFVHNLFKASGYNVEQG